MYMNEKNKTTASTGVLQDFDPSLERTFRGHKGPVNSVIAPISGNVAMAMVIMMVAVTAVAASR